MVACSAVEVRIRRQLASYIFRTVEPDRQHFSEPLKWIFSIFLCQAPETKEEG